MGACACLTQKAIPYIEQEDDIKSGGATEEDQKTKQTIDEYMENQRRIERRIKKVILLGIGACGKSTLFKQLKEIYKDGLDESEYLEAKFVVRSNCINSILVLLKKSQILYEMDEDKHSDCFIDLDQDPSIIKHIQLLLEYATPNAVKIGVNKLTEESAKILCGSISYLWSLPQVKNTWYKHQHFSFIENMDYMFQRVPEMFKLDYEPTMEDTLKCRIRTTGLMEEKFIINNVQYNIFDTGGERNERKKWIALFEGVTAVIYVAALNHYCRVLFEDECKNAMQESLELFGEICNQKWFRRSEMILLLSKDDLFQQRLREGKSLSIAFGDKWDGPDYQRKYDEKEDKTYFDKCHEAALEFIRKQYDRMNQNPNKKIFVHVVTSTDKENIERVFWDVQNIIISSTLRRPPDF